MLRPAERRAGAIGRRVLQKARIDKFLRKRDKRCFAFERGEGRAKAIKDGLPAQDAHRSVKVSADAVDSCRRPDTDWLVPEPGARRIWEPAALDARVRPLLLERVRRELDPFLRAMRRRFDRDHARVHEYHDELRCLLLAFRYAAVSDDKREGLVWLGFNQSTGAVLDNVLSRLQPLIAQDTDWLVPEPGARRIAGAAWEPAALDARVRPLLLERVRRELDPFLRAMRRRFDRDHARVHEYHDELRRASHCKLATLASAVGDKSEADRKRETLRVAAIEREYAAKLEDLRHNYALSVTIEWVQALELFVPVQRFSALVRRRKGERLVRLDWHPVARLMEPPLCDWGAGIERTRLVCDEKLHLTEPAGQAPCPACGKAWCRACSPAACPRCGQPIERPTALSRAPVRS